MADLRKEQFEDGAVLLIERRFKSRSPTSSMPTDVRTGHWYKFAAVKVAGRWYLTGPAAPRTPFDDWEFKAWCGMSRATTRVYWAPKVIEIP